MAEWHVIADDTIRDMRAHFQTVCESWAGLDEKIRAVERQHNTPERGLTAAMLYKETGAPLSDETKEPARSWTWQSCAEWRGCLTAGIGLSQQWVLCGGSIEKLKEIMGHYSVVVTERYTHLRTDLFAERELDAIPFDLRVRAPGNAENGAKMGPRQADPSRNVR